MNHNHDILADLLIQHVRACMERAGISQRELARRAGISSTAQISLWLRGERSLAFAKQLRVLAELSRINPAWWDEGIDILRDARSHFTQKNPPGGAG